MADKEKLRLGAHAQHQEALFFVKHDDIADERQSETIVSLEAKIRELTQK